MGPGFESPTGHHVGAKSAPLRFKAVPFGDRLKTALRSFAPPFQLEPAALGFELVWGTVLMAGASEVAASFLSTQDVVKNRLFMPVVLFFAELCLTYHFLYSANALLRK